MYAIYHNLEQEIYKEAKVPKGVDPHEFGRQLVAEAHPKLNTDQVKGEWGRWGRIERNPNVIS